MQSVNKLYYNKLHFLQLDNYFSVFEVEILCKHVDKILCKHVDEILCKHVDKNFVSMSTKTLEACRQKRKFLLLHSINRKVFLEG